MRIICWFSCGAASAVATKLLIEQNNGEHEIEVVRIAIPEEHADNDRFATDCEQWFGQKIHTISSSEHPSCESVWETRKYMAGINGAPCTSIMKSDVRRQFQQFWMPDVQSFGFTEEERKRADRFRENNPEVFLVCPLHKNKITKEDCFTMLRDAGIILPVMYLLGFKNNNCIGCVKSTSVKYWQKIRRYFPEVFARRAALSRLIGARLVRVKGERIFLDEMPLDFDDGIEEQDIECSLICVTEEETA